MKLGYALCGSFCTVPRSISVLETLARENEIVPIMSDNLMTCDTRFGRASDILTRVEEICGRRVISNIVEAEPLGPREPLDAMIICPCTGNTLAKLAAGISDGAVTLAAKAHLRQGRPLIIALASNDALSANFKNIAELMQRRSIYFVPLAQDEPRGKPYSLVCDFDRVGEALSAAREGRRLAPFFVN